MSVLTERRKFVRYMLPYDTLYVFDHYSARVGWVRDVSMGGLALEIYHEVDAEHNSGVFDIFAFNPERFYIPSVTCEQTFLLSAEGKRCSNSYLYRVRCGQHIVSLTAEQKTMWHDLIKKLSKYSDLNYYANVYDPLRLG
jgi:hypothetical protein